LNWRKADGVTERAQADDDAGLRPLVFHCPHKGAFSRESKDYDDSEGKSCR
jgi:hypothetical protein